MDTLDRQLWTLDELAARVAAALSVGYPGAPSARVRAVPDPRAIRYYGTLGLLDRPAKLRGRTALYARRHLLQLVAIKRLQADGLSLAAVQERLAGAGDDALEPIAKLPAELESLVPALPPPAEPEPADERARFWSAAPAPLSAARARLPAEPPPASHTLQAIELAPAVTVLLDTVRPLTPEDLEAVRAAAAPLLASLRTRGALQP